MTQCKIYDTNKPQLDTGIITAMVMANLKNKPWYMDEEIKRLVNNK